MMQGKGHGWVGDNLPRRLRSLANDIGMEKDDAKLFAEVMERYRAIPVPFHEAVPMAIGAVCFRGAWHVYFSNVDSEKNMKKNIDR